MFPLYATRRDVETKRYAKVENGIRAISLFPPALMSPDGGGGVGGGERLAWIPLQRRRTSRLFVRGFFAGVCHRCSGIQIERGTELAESFIYFKKRGARDP